MNEKTTIVNPSHPDSVLPAGANPIADPVMVQLTAAAFGPLLADAIRQRWETGKAWEPEVVGVLACQAAWGAKKALQNPDMWGPK